MEIAVTSTSAIKVNAILEVFPDSKVSSYLSPSDIPEQPFGRTEIERGANNRLAHVCNEFVVSFETGMILKDNVYYDITCCVLKTKYGKFTSWSTLHEFMDQEKAKRITQSDRSQTYGTQDDWYALESQICRQRVLSLVLIDAYKKFQCVSNSMPDIDVEYTEFKNVNFIDIQTTLIKQPSELSLGVRRLADRLQFNTVVVLDARGFLLAGEFMKEGYPIVMVRKKGKLPNPANSVSYEKEYGQSEFEISNGCVDENTRAIVIDDLVATGGSMKAAEKLVNSQHGKVVCFIAPFALCAVDDHLMSDIHNLRYLTSGSDTYIPKVPTISCDSVSISPSNLQILTRNCTSSGIRWDKYRRSSNISMPKYFFENRRVLVFMDPSDAAATYDLLNILSILHRKDPKEIIVVVPFIDQSTQDRIEYKDGYETVALIDTFAKLVGNHKVITFDIHAEQSFGSFYDLRNLSLVEHLWKKYLSEHPDVIPVFPDDGAKKRFSSMSGIDDPITFRKERRGDQRIINTDDREWTPRKYVIIDDLVRSGGTMNTVATFLKNHHAISVDCLFAHAPFEPAASVNMEIFNDVWTSDSCPSSTPDHMVKVSVSDVLEKYFYRRFESKYQ